MNKIPESIDKYPIESLIATGGMGAVYKGMHPTLNRPVILKKLLIKGSPAIAERFRREARILTDFRHDNIVDVYDHFKSGGAHYIVMEFVDGISVEGLIDRQRYLDDATACWILLQTAKALVYAHAKQVVHRDIKPANVLISRTGEVKLADFGIASSRDEEDQGLTREGVTLGTPAYMAPEQFESTRSVDKRADIYSLGVMLYEMMTGKRPYSGGFSPELMMAIKKGRYKAPQKLNPAISPFLLKLIRRMMRSDLRYRCQDLADVIPRLKRHLARYDQAKVIERLVALVEDRECPPAKPRKRNKVKAVLVAGVLGALVLSAAFAWAWQMGWHLRLLSPTEYGQVWFVVDAGAAGANLGQVRTTLYQDDNKFIPPIEASPWYLVLPFLDSASVQSLPVNLKTGHYRAKTVVGHQVFWTSFHVDPWSLRSEPLVIRQKYLEPVSQPLRIEKRVHDALSGRDLSGEALVEIKEDGEYRDLAYASTPQTGRVVDLRISHADYFPQDFQLSIQIEEDSCILNAALVPEPVSLRIELPDNQTGFTVNHAATVPVIENARVVEKAIQAKQINILNLAPGLYNLEFSRQGRTVSRSLQLSAGSPASLFVSLKNDNLNVDLIDPAGQ